MIVAELRPPHMELLFERGERHEQKVLGGVVAGDVASPIDGEATPGLRAEPTLAAMRRGGGSCTKAAS